jgi:hypothetical protein
MVPWLLLVAALSSACASGQTRLEPGTRVDIPSDGPEPGFVEAEALAHLVQMTEILERSTADPQDTVVAMGRYLEAHRAEIFRVVRQLEARLAQMTAPERIYYEERFSDYFAGAMTRWSDAFTAFRRVHPEAASRLDGLMLYFD